jgi:hypothetical protein
MADQKLTELDAITASTDDDLLYIVDDPGGTPVSKKITVDNFLWGVIQASQLINEIKGWPPIVNTGDLDVLNLWWDKFGTPSTAPSVVSVSGEGITEDYLLALKVVANDANEGLYQRFTYADEPRVKSGRAFSTLWAIWCVSGVGVTLSIKDSTAAETTASEVTAAAWTIVEVPNHTLAGTYVDIILQTDGAGTFYAVPLGANIGARGFPLKPRGARRVDALNTPVIVNVDPGGADYTDLDLTAYTSNLCFAICGSWQYRNQSNTGKMLRARRNGTTINNYCTIIIRNVVQSMNEVQTKFLFTDDGQVIEWRGSDTAGDAEYVYMDLDYWLEWE